MTRGIAQPPTVAPSDRDKAYAAAYIDGEGCITLCGPGTRVRGLRRGIGSYHASIQVSSAVAAPLIFLRERWGGSIHLRTYVARKCTRPTYAWQCASRMAEQMCIDIRPDLLIKGPQADVVIEFYRIHDGTRRPHYGKGRSGYKPLEQSELSRRSSLILDIRELNRRGLPQDPTAEFERLDSILSKEAI